MGLLGGAGRRLKGLLVEGGLPDILAEAGAYLEGDYGRAIGMASRRRHGRKRRASGRWEEKEWLARSGEGGFTATPEGQPDDGTIIEHPLTRQRMVYKQGNWKPWQ